MNKHHLDIENKWLTTEYQIRVPENANGYE